MIPFVEQPSVSVGPVTVHAFGAIVVVAAMTGVWLARAHIRKSGLDTIIGERMFSWVLGGGFLGAHLVHVLLYEPETIASDPLVILRVWDGISSFGGIVGGIAALWIFLRYRSAVAPTDRVRYLDVAAVAFPTALLIGRFACTLAHDHVGRVTNFALAINASSTTARELVARAYSSGTGAVLPPDTWERFSGFHDLGWYEFLFLGLIVVPGMRIVSRRVLAPGAASVAFILLYMPGRFALDFLRVADVRYWFLTPAQWLALLFIAVGVSIYIRTRQAAAVATNSGTVRH